MEACSTASGGVLFVPDHIEGASRPVSYKEFAEQEKSGERIGVFGRKKVAAKKSSLDARQVA